MSAQETATEVMFRQSERSFLERYPEAMMQARRRFQLSCYPIIRMIVRVHEMNPNPPTIIQHRDGKVEIQENLSPEAEKTIATLREQIARLHLKILHTLIETEL